MDRPGQTTFLVNLEAQRQRLRRVFAYEPDQTFNKSNLAPFTSRAGETKRRVEALCREPGL
jgi:hypothetical protein